MNEPVNYNIHSVLAVEDLYFITIILPDYDRITRYCNFY